MQKNDMTVSKIVFLLLALSAVPVYTAKHVSGINDIFEAVEKKNLDAVKFFVYHRKFNKKNKDGDTELHKAVECGLKEITIYLLENDVDVNAKNNFGWTPLHVAAFCGQTEILKQLIKKGADVNAQDNTGWTPLHVAAFWGQTEILKYLIKKGVDVNAQDNTGATPLYRATQKGNWEAVKDLILKGANINAKNNNGWTPLHAAAFWGQTEMLKYLTENGADENAKTAACFFKSFPYSDKTPYEVAGSDKVRIFIDLGKLGFFVKKYLSNKELIDDRSLGLIINMMQCKFNVSAPQNLSSQAMNSRLARDTWNKRITLELAYKPAVSKKQDNPLALLKFSN